MGRPTQQVHVFAIQDRRGHNKTRPWVVRWRLYGHERTRSFRTRAEADRHRSLLVHASTIGETFDPVSCEPTAWGRQIEDVTVHRWAQRWVAEQWVEWQPRTRRSAIEALTRFLPLVVREGASRPPSTPARRPDGDARPRPGRRRRLRRVRWLEGHGLLRSMLDKQVLAEVERRLGIADNGRPLAAITASRRRKVARACVRRAVQLDLLASDPWPPAPAGRSARKANRKRQRVDVQALPDPKTMVRILDAIPSHQPGSRTYQLMTAVVYYAGLRPSEVVMLRRRCLTLPNDATTWGRIDVTEADIDFDKAGCSWALPAAASSPGGNSARKRRGGRWDRQPLPRIVAGANHRLHGDR